MDNLCHTLAGAALGEAGLNRRTRLAATTLMIASNLPDIDVLVFATGTPPVAFRRGWTHGVLAQVLLPLLFAGIMYLVGRRRSATADSPKLSGPWLMALSYVGVFLHVGMDWLNNYGVRLLMPFQRRWFYGDAIFIVDPWMWLMLAAGVWLARQQRATRPARAALLATGLYVAMMLLSARAARGIVADAWAAANGRAPVAVMVGPMPVTPLRRSVIIDARDRYATGVFTWFPTEVRFDPRSTPKNDMDPRVAPALAAPPVRAFLVWSRFPYWTITPEPGGGSRVAVGDMRFPAAGVGRFSASTVVDAQRR